MLAMFQTAPSGIPARPITPDRAIATANTNGVRHQASTQPLIATVPAQLPSAPTSASRAGVGAGLCGDCAPPRKRGRFHIDRPVRVSTKYVSPDHWSTCSVVEFRGE